MAQLDDAGVAAGTRGEPRPEVFEQPVRDGLVLDPSFDQPAGVQVAPTRQRDEPLGVGAELLLLGLGRLDAVVAEQAGGQVREQRLLVGRSARELPALGAVAHYSGSRPAPPPTPPASPSASLTCACGAMP